MKKNQTDKYEFAKTYLDCLSTFKGYPKSLNPIFLGFLKYASPSKAHGGHQVVYVNKGMKEEVAKACGISYTRVEQAITGFVKNDIWKRVASGTYQVNPEILGEGDLEDIQNIRTTFDFDSGEFESTFELKAPEDTEAY